MVMLFLLAASAWSCKSQKQTGDSASIISEKTKELAQKVRNDNLISSERIGRDSQSSPSYQKAEQLKEQASLSELRLLTDDENAVLSGVAFEGLSEREYDEIDEVLVKFIERDDRVSVVTGDILRDIPLLQYAFENVLGYSVNDPMQKPEKAKQISPELERIIRSKLYSGPPKE